MIIDLGHKLVSKSVNTVIKKYWSFKSKAVYFDCSKLEWISTSEIAFFFSWIRALEYNSIQVTIQLQSSDGLIFSGEVYRKRKYCLERLLIQWRLREHVSEKTALISGGIQTDSKSVKTVSDYAPLPLQVFNPGEFDQKFENIFNRYLRRFADHIRAGITKTDISYYDSQFLDYSVFKELYSNTCLHANSEIIDECFLTIGLNKKFSGSSSYLSESRLSELTDAELHFFSEDGKYRNIDFIEMTFHDFGIGIAKSLFKNYKEETEENLEKFFGKHYKTHIEQEPDTRVIEYALLLFTSRLEIERKLEIHDYIPRGLYIIKELVKQYHGYFEISSGRGFIGLSFKDGQTHLRYRGTDDAQMFFPGTRVKIVFPALKVIGEDNQEKFKVTARASAKESVIKHIHILREYCEVESEITRGNSLNIKQFQENIVARFFTRILLHFRECPENSLVMIDFAGAEPSTVDFYNKFIYFVTHFPLYGKRKLVFYNLIVKGLNRTIIRKQKDDLKSKGIIASIIPCIHLDHDVEWLGFDQTNDVEQYTRKWVENEGGIEILGVYASYKTGREKIKTAIDYGVSLRLPSFDFLLSSINEEITKVIQAELDNNGIQYASLQADGKMNYNDVSVEKNNTCYLTARGKIVLRYISFTEKLYIISYRRMIAAFLVFKLYSTIKPKSRLKKINKILSVTLSSQMIGHEVELMLSDLSGSVIKLVALSNYYNFQNEENFNEITPASKVLIVCDVVSTGNLINNMVTSIEFAEARPVTCISIVNLSQNDSTSIDTPIISLANEILQYYEKAPENYAIEVINPVMNVPTSMPRSKSFENVLMTKSEFLSKVDERFLAMGNLKNNSVYFNYFLNTKELLLSDKDNDYPLLKELLRYLRAKKQGDSNFAVLNLIKGIGTISKNTKDPKTLAAFEKSKKQLEIIIQNNPPDLFNEYTVDVVFYPFLSNISVVERDITPFIESKVNDSALRVFPIPRIMTTKGWRFSFPPKFLNYLFSKEKLSVLILDDGALTGDSISQMIDSISFLSVKSIDVLTIFGRVEDFQKELFSRIKSIQVKNDVAPLNVYFGTHLNIPVHNQFDSPFQIEYREILLLESKIINNLKIELSDQFEDYLQSKKTYLLNAQHPSSGDINFYFFPRISAIKLFDLRDFIGRFGSYRLYVDDFQLNSIDTLIASKDDFIAMLIVLNLEPQLYQTFKRMFREETIDEKISLITTDFLSDPELMNEDWKREFFIKSLFHLSSKWFFKKDNLLLLVEKLFDHSKGNQYNCFKYLEYTILTVALGIKNVDNTIEARSFEADIEGFISDLKTKNEAIFREMRLGFSVFHQIQQKKNLDINFYINKYYFLRKYYTQAKLFEDKHDEMLLPNYFSGLLKAVSELKYSIENKITPDVAGNTAKLYSELGLLQTKYSQELNFKFIQEIVSNLHHFASTDLPFDVSKAMSVIKDLEQLLKASNHPITSGLLEQIITTLNDYKNTLLRSDCEFARYILNATGHLLDEWNRTEFVFISQKGNSGMRRIDKAEVKNIAVNVHPYALNLAFENILKNKFVYAKDVPWRMKTRVSKSVVELIIEQDSAFDKSGDGTGQSAIKSIFRGYGVQYRKLKDNPYTLKLTFSNKFDEYEST